MIETIENHYAGRPYRVELTFPEFTSICPLTGAPDFGTITITYVPSERLLEQKALRDFLTGFRGREIFQEEAVNRILDEVVTSCEPPSARSRASSICARDGRARLLDMESSRQKFNHCKRGHDHGPERPCSWVKRSY